MAGLTDYFLFGSVAVSYPILLDRLLRNFEFLEVVTADYLFFWLLTMTFLLAIMDLDFVYGGVVNTSFSRVNSYIWIDIGFLRADWFND